MSYSATERFARTYTPRVPDDSYDSLGGAAIPDSIIDSLPERPFHHVAITSGFGGGALAQTLVPTGQASTFNMSTVFTGGLLTTQAETATSQIDKFQLTAVMSGGTLQ